MFKKRWIAQRLSTSLDFANVIVLTGARQTGKTTLLKNEPIFSDYKYFTLDDFDVLAQIEKDPFEILLSGEKVIIDEAQKFPKIMVAIKKIVDEKKSKFCFVWFGKFVTYEKCYRKLCRTSKLQCALSFCSGRMGRKTHT